MLWKNGAICISLDAASRIANPPTAPSLSFAEPLAYSSALVTSAKMRNDCSKPCCRQHHDHGPRPSFADCGIMTPV